METVGKLAALTIIVVFACPQSRSLPLPDAASSYEETHPVETDSNGTPLAHQMWLSSNAPSTQEFSGTRYFSINLQGNSLLLNLTKNERFLSRQEVPVHRVGQDGTTTTHVISSSGNDCRYTGTVHRSGKEPPVGWAAISTCKGMHGLVSLESATFSIEPHKPEFNQGTHGPVWRHRVEWHAPSSKQSATDCGTTGIKEDQVISMAKEQGLKRHAHMTSEKIIETALVVDNQTLDYHGNYADLVAYILDIMNVVSHIFQDASTGSAVNAVLVKLIVVESDQSPFEESSVASTLKSSFCKWQSSDPVMTSVEHDIAVLVTRKNMCEVEGHCSILGVANLKSMCTSEKSCVVVKDTGLSVAYTIAHEIGHSLGLNHDGDINSDCQSGYYLMAPSFSKSSNPHTWSECSKRSLQDFFLSRESSCLDNVPQATIAPPPSSVPIIGEKYTLDEQCALLYGPSAVFCANKTNEVCEVLHCQLAEGAECVSKSSPPAPGSPCTLQNGTDGLCYQGRCEHYSVLSQPVDGAWGQWEPWGSCNKKCGSGVQSRERHCNAPEPAYGGHPCTGEKRQYRLCNTHECDINTDDYRNKMCSKYNKQAVYSTTQGASDKWAPLSIDIAASYRLHPCQLHCINQLNHYIYTLEFTVEDGTSCLTEHSSIKGVCIKDECIKIGCDDQLGTEFYTDACGVKCGNGSTCQSTTGIFTPSVSSGEGETVVVIPSGSWNIHIQETTPSNNSLIAIGGSNTFFGIMYPPSRQHWALVIGGTTWYYFNNDGEVSWLESANAISEEITIQVVVNDPNGKLQYSFASPLSSDNKNIQPILSYTWNTSNWSLCSSLCDNGQESRKVYCVSQAGEEVDDELCDGMQKPTTVQTCFNEPCDNFQWLAGNWSQCDTYCGLGSQTRQVTCQRLNGSQVDDQYCVTHAMPAKVRGCENTECPSWVKTAWTECSATCDGGTRERTTKCLSSDGHLSVNCDLDLRPADEEETCNTQPCCSDKFDSNYCVLIRNLSYCSVPFYGEHCCYTCSE